MNLNRLAREYEQKRLQNLERLLASAPRAPTHRPAPARHTPRRDLNATLRAAQRALLQQKAQRAREEEERRLRLLALQFPAVPRTRVTAKKK